VRKLFVLAALASLVVGCRNGIYDIEPTRAPQSQASPSPEAKAEYLAEMEGSSKLNQNRRLALRVHDIMLPLTSAHDEPTNHVTHEFTLWADNPETQDSAYKRWRDGRLRIEVEGPPAKITQVAYNESSAVPSEHDGGKQEPSRSLLRIEVSTRDLTRSFRILAWEDEPYNRFEDERSRVIEDLQARIRLGRGYTITDATRKAFTNDCFNVCLAQCPAWLSPYELGLKLEEVIGLPNPWGEVKEVLVYGGDLKTNILMLSKDQVIDNFGPNFEKYFLVGRVSFTNKHPDKALVIYTTSLAANCLFYREPDKKLAKYFLRNGNMKRFEYTKRYKPLITPSRSQGKSTRAGNKPATIYEVLSKAAGTAKNDISIRTEERPARVPSSLVPKQASIVADLDAILGGGTAGARYDECRTCYRRAYGDAVATYNATFELFTSQGLKPMKARGWATAIAGAGQAAPAKVRSFMAGDAEASPVVINAAVAEAQRVAYEQARWLASEVFVTSTPLRRAVPVEASPTRKHAAFSPLIHRQGMMASAGYLFKDFYRPMTFRGVLTSLWEKTRNRPRTQALDWLRSLGTVAGALVGLDSIGPFGKDWFRDGTLVATSVIIPEIRKRLKDDIEQYVKNLEKMGLDEVVKIAPNSQAEGYVFFPKGPIFGFAVDEFSVDTPTFIVNIDNANVVAHGFLVDKSADISSGRVDAHGLVAEALSRGKAEREEEERERLALEERRRAYDLVEATRKARNAIATSSDAEAGKLKAQGYVLTFMAKHGAMPASSVFASLLTEVGLKADAKVAPPPGEFESLKASVEEFLKPETLTSNPSARDQARRLVDAFVARYPLWKQRGTFDALLLKVGSPLTGGASSTTAAKAAAKDATEGQTLLTWIEKRGVQAKVAWDSLPAATVWATLQKTLVGSGANTGDGIVGTILQTQKVWRDADPKKNKNRAARLKSLYALEWQAPETIAAFQQVHGIHTMLGATPGGGAKARVVVQVDSSRANAKAAFADLQKACLVVDNDARTKAAARALTRLRVERDRIARIAEQIAAIAAGLKSTEAFLDQVEKAVAGAPVK